MMKTSLLQTVEENKQFYTNRQVARAKIARKLYHNIGTPSIPDYKAIIRMNAISNCPVTIDDINIAEQIYGKDIGSLKGKTTRSKPLPVIKNYIEIPTELIRKHEEVEISIDMMFVNKIPFLTTISKSLMYRTAQPLENKTPTAYRSALDTVFRVYNHAGFSITTIKADQEFKPILDEIKDVLNITMNYANAQEHVPEAERNNRTIKERFRAQYHRMPFKAIPKVMIKALVMEVTKKLNFFPPKGGVSKYYSPRMIMHQSSLDYTKHFQYEFGQFVQAHDNNTITKNTPASRTIDCIYLRYTSNMQGGHELLDLATKRIITRHAITEVPMSNTIIARVEQLAKQDGIYQSNRPLIAGVDHDDDDNDDNENENEGNDNDNDDDDDDDDNDDDDNDEGGVDNENTNETNEPIAQNDNAMNENEDDESAQTEMIVFEDENEPLFEDYNEEQDEDEDEPIDHTEPRRSTRIVNTPINYVPSFGGKKYQHLHVQLSTNTKEYDNKRAYIGAMIINKINLMDLSKEELSSMHLSKEELSLVQTYSLKKGLKKYKDKGYVAAFGEMKQLHDRICFRPIDPSTMTPEERKKAMETLIFLTEKRDGRIKARTVANGSVQRKWMTKEESTSPTSMNESVILTAVIDAMQGRDIATVDIPNAFIQTKVPNDGKERILIKIRRALVDFLVEIDPDTYTPYVTYQKGEKILYYSIALYSRHCMVC